MPSTQLSPPPSRTTFPAGIVLFAMIACLSAGPVRAEETAGPEAVPAEVQAEVETAPGASEAVETSETPESAVEPADAVESASEAASRAPDTTASQADAAPEASADSEPAPTGEETEAPPVSASGEGGAPAGAAPIGGVGLDSLLTLPGSRVYTIDRKAGLTQGEWRARFKKARGELAEEREALADAHARMDRAAEGGDWKIAPPLPGAQGSPSETTIDFKLRQEIRRHEDEIERLERRLNDLEIEANLAAVPDEWRT